MPRRKLWSTAEISPRDDDDEEEALEQPVTSALAARQNINRIVGMDVVGMEIVGMDMGAFPRVARVHDFGDANFGDARAAFLTVAPFAQPYQPETSFVGPKAMFTVRDHPRTKARRPGR